MPYPLFDRSRLTVKKLADRRNKVSIEDGLVPLTAEPANLSEGGRKLISLCAGRIRAARVKSKPVIMAFGAHTIKNGLGPLITELISKGWITHLATNGAGIIHDWELAFQGKTSEDVRENVDRGQFGIWEETGMYINLALVAGAYEGLGYGESVGKMINEEGLQIPGYKDLLDEAMLMRESDPSKAAAALDLSDVIKKHGLSAGFMKIPHPYKEFSLQGSAYKLKIPFTGHPMIGHDIIYNHPLNHGAAIGRTAIRDFLSYASAVSNIDEGVYISLGSAVMSPMIFEKALSMSQNVEISKNRHIDNHFMLVVDLASSDWDWNSMGEPPPDNPSYYLRYCKTFHRMGGEMHYLSADNRDFLLELYRNLA